MKCAISDVSCVYHACMSDNCQKKQVVEHNKISLGEGNCSKQTITVCKKVTKGVLKYYVGRKTSKGSWEAYTADFPTYLEAYMKILVLIKENPGKFIYKKDELMIV